MKVNENAIPIKERKEAPAERVHDHFHQGEAEADQATTDHRRYGGRRVHSKYLKNVMNVESIPGQSFMANALFAKL